MSFDPRGTETWKGEETSGGIYRIQSPPEYSDGSGFNLDMDIIMVVVIAAIICYSILI